jgi:AIG2-like family
MIYFAFGSNMDPRQMVARCPSHRAIGRAVLAGHRLCFPRRSPVRNCGTTGLLPARGHIIWGVLYELAESDLVRLHAAEGYMPGRRPEENRHDFVEIEVRRDSADGNTTRAFTYVARPDNGGAAPSAGYLRLLIYGAEHHHLPHSYIAQLRSIAAAYSASSGRPSP